jgi:hypothetical protein
VPRFLVISGFTRSSDDILRSHPGSRTNARAGQRVYLQRDIERSEPDLAPLKRDADEIAQSSDGRKPVSQAAASNSVLGNLQG